MYYGRGPYVGCVLLLVLSCLFLSAKNARKQHSPDAHDVCRQKLKTVAGSFLLVEPLASPPTTKIQNNSCPLKSISHVGSSTNSP